MTALAAAKQIVQLGEDTLPPMRAAGVLTNKVVYHGALVGLSGGYYAPATTAIAGLGVADLEMWNDTVNSGQAQSSTIPNIGFKIDTTGVSSGVRKMTVRHGVFKFNNKGGDLVTAPLIGAKVYVEDDTTVRATASGSVVAGYLMGFADDGLPLVLVQPGLA